MVTGGCSVGTDGVTGVVTVVPVGAGTVTGMGVVQVVVLGAPINVGVGAACMVGTDETLDPYVGME